MVTTKLLVWLWHAGVNAIIWRRLLNNRVPSVASADSQRSLQAVGSGACEGFIDDPGGDLAAHGVSCDQVLALGCSTDLGGIQPTMPQPRGELLLPGLVRRVPPQGDGSMGRDTERLRVGYLR
eukprot:COSAG06_NODE_2757_length_6335_cov_3.434734_3_plen_123_part_00